MCLKLLFPFDPGSGRSHVWDEPVSWEGTELCSHVRYSQPDVTDRKPAAAPAGRVRSVGDVHSSTLWIFFVHISKRCAFFSCSVWCRRGGPCDSLLPLLLHQWHAPQLQAPWPAVQHGAGWGLAQVHTHTHTTEQRFSWKRLFCLCRQEYLK